MKLRKHRGEAPSGAPNSEHREGDASSASYGAHTRKSTARFPIVGIGASAGGLEAVEQFLSSLPSDTGMAFVLVSHLDPSHKSVLAELLSNRTAMPVLQAEGRMPVETNHLYVIPPNCYLTIEDHLLRLTNLEEQRSLRMPIDQFLRSLAHEHKEDAVAVILSGNGSDGTRIRSR